ncbi:MAG: hypothetical protein ACI9UJ_001855 [bacterium]
MLGFEVDTFININAIPHYSDDLSFVLVKVFKMVSVDELLRLLVVFYTLGLL